MITQLTSSAAVREFISQKTNAIVTFSAHWCGPCKASHGQLEALAASPETAGTDFGIAYESDLGDDLHTFNVRAFPTYVLFQNGGTETARVQGVNFAGIEAMIKEHCKATLTGGETLGGGTSSATISPQEARAARLARLGGSAAPAAATTTQPEPMVQDDETKPAATTTTAQNDDKPDDDVQMEDAEENPPTVDPTAALDPALVETLEGMGFLKLRAQKALLRGNGTVEGAVEWLGQHQDDADIDDPIEMVAAVAHSYKCNDCGKILSNMANLELHANKTGHSDFEECTTSVKPLTPEEKQAKILEIKSLLKAKRAEREEAEKVESTTREIQRRTMGKEMSKTREQMDMEKRKRETKQRKKEKQDFQRERARIKAELAKDKAERIANKGKLSSKLGVGGYNPDGIQYDLDTNDDGGGNDSSDPQQQKQKKLKASATKIDDYISKISAYKAGGDGGKCLKLLLTFVSNVADKPDEEKYRSINTDSKAFRLKIKQFIGAKNLLMAVGFAPTENGEHLVLNPDTADRELLLSTKGKLEAALVAF